MTNSSQECRPIQIVPLRPSRSNVCDSLRKSNIFRSLLSSCSSRVHFLYHFFCFHLKALQSLKIFPKIRELSPSYMCNFHMKSLDLIVCSAVILQCSHSYIPQFHWCDSGFTSDACYALSYVVNFEINKKVVDFLFDVWCLLVNPWLQYQKKLFPTVNDICWGNKSQCRYHLKLCGVFNVFSIEH